MVEKRYSKKRHPVSTTVDAAVNDAYGIIEGLRDDVRASLESLEEKFSGTARYETLDATATTLDAVDDTPEEVDVLDEISVEYTINVRKGISRAIQLQNASNGLEACVSALEEWLDDEKNAERDDLEDVRSFKDIIENMASELDSVEFPGWN